MDEIAFIRVEHLYAPVPSMGSLEMIFKELKEDEIITNFIVSNNYLVDSLAQIYMPELVDNTVSELFITLKNNYKRQAALLNLDFDVFWWAMATDHWFSTMLVSQYLNIQDVRKKASKHHSSLRKNIDQNKNKTPWDVNLLRFPEYRECQKILGVWEIAYRNNTENRERLDYLKLSEISQLKMLAKYNESKYKSTNQRSSFICQFCKKTISPEHSRQKKSCNNCTNKYSVLTSQRNRNHPHAIKNNVNSDLLIPKRERKRGICECGKKRLIVKDGKCNECIKNI
jgi:hypothetical protein